MTDLNARTLGTAVPVGDFEARVHSVFPQAANLERGQGSLLLTLVTAEQADLPQGIRLGTPPDFSFESLLDPGERLVCRSGVLEDRAGRISIDLREAARWSCSLPALDPDRIAPATARAWNLTWQALNERQARARAEVRAEDLLRAEPPGQAAVARRLGPLVRALVEAVRRLDPPGQENLTGLIGLGPGLTPAGDDLLVGFLTGLRCTSGDHRERLAFLSALGKAVRSHSRRTNDISRTYLFHATRGQVSSRLAALAEAVVQGQEPARLLESAEAAMRVGHSSGMETVTGLLIGLASWGHGLPAD